MKKYLFIILINLCLNLQAQILYSDATIPYPSSQITEKDKHGFFVAQKIKGKISGTGIYKYKNGNLYIGDFKDKIPNGFGMLICSDSDTIKNCPKAKIYVGRFKDGLKRGKGVCYDINGEIIYSGKFDNDQFRDTLTCDDINLRYFSDAKTDDFYYIGEFVGTAPDGYGAIFFSNGDILISRFQNGNRIGINIYIESDGNWLSENVTDGNSAFISSSREYASYVAGSKSEWNATWKKTLGSLEDWASALGNLSEQLGGNIAKNSNSRYREEMNASQKQDSPSNSSRYRSPSGIYDLAEQRAYNQDKSTYSKYDGMLSHAFAGTRNVSPSEIKSWQNKMKQLRKKWEAKGKNFPHFPNEDK